MSHAIPLAGRCDHWSAAGVGQVLLITHELLWWGTAEQAAQPQCTQLCRKTLLVLLTHCSELFPGGWCMLLSTDRAGKEEKKDEPSTENNVKSSKRGAHTALHKIILHLWHFILMTVQPFLLGKDPSGSVWCANHSCPEGNTAGTRPSQMCWACV